MSLQNSPNPNQPLLLSSRGPAAQWPPLYQSFTNIGAEIAAAISFPQTGQTATQAHRAPQPRFIQQGLANSRGSPLQCELWRWNLRNSLHFWVKAYMRRVEWKISLWSNWQTPARRPWRSAATLTHKYITVQRLCLSTQVSPALSEKCVGVRRATCFCVKLVRPPKSTWRWLFERRYGWLTVVSKHRAVWNQENTSVSLKMFPRSPSGKQQKIDLKIGRLLFSRNCLNATWKITGVFLWKLCRHLDRIMNAVGHSALFSSGIKVWRQRQSPTGLFCVCPLFLYQANSIWSPLINAGTKVTFCIVALLMIFCHGCSHLLWLFSCQTGPALEWDCFFRASF